MHLTKKQKEIFGHIASFISQNGYAPSIMEIGEKFGLSSPATIHKHLTNLEAKGLIRRLKNMSRAIELVQMNPEMESSIQIPLLGTIVAGEPLESYQVEETITVPSDMIGRNRTYALKVRGESMIEEHIKDGDFVIVDERNHADNGETVVALVNNNSVTLKKFYRENGTVRLQPANLDMSPIVVPIENVTVQGVVIGVLRKF